MSAVLVDKDYFLKENVTGQESSLCKFRYACDSENLYFQFVVEDEDIISPYSQDNEDLFNADAVEVFIAGKGDLQEYYELEVSPYGVRFFGKIVNLDGQTPQLERITPNFEAKASVTDKGYTVAITLPHSSIGGFDQRTMKMNAFHLDKKRDGRLLLFALNPTLCGSFHRPKFFQ